ncbi:MAG: hypothetical protein ACTHJM_03010 [Marmoricola sp.]
MSRVGPRLRAVLVIVAALAAGMIGSAVAAPFSSSPDSTDVGFISIAPHRLLTNVSIASKHSSSPVVIGGSTTVPTDATTVQLSITAHSVGGGTIAIYSTGNPGADDHFLYYYKNTTVSGLYNEHPGLGNEVTLTNTGLSAVTVTVSIVGYSTQVNAGSINGSGGSAGQVLTNTASGATWQTQGDAYAAPLGEWVNVDPSGNMVPVATLNVPAGSYNVQAVLELDSGPGRLLCTLVSPRGGRVAYAPVLATMNDQFLLAPIGGLLTTSGGTVSLTCENLSGDTHLVALMQFIATRVSSANGNVEVDAP